MNLRRIAIESVVASLIFSGFWSWGSVEPSSVATYFIVAAIMFVPVLGIRLILDVGGALLAEERDRKRRAGVHDDPF